MQKWHCHLLCETCSLNYERSATSDIFSGISFSAEAHTYLQTGQAVNSQCYSNCEAVRLERQGVRMVTHKMLLIEAICRDMVMALPQLPDLVHPLAS